MYLFITLIRVTFMLAVLLVYGIVYLFVSLAMLVNLAGGRKLRIKYPRFPRMRLYL